MSIAVAHPSSAAKPSVSVPGRRYDHLFFSALALLLLATVFVGFARSYYLAGVFRAPLPTRIVHLHGAAFSCWILLLVVQTSLVFADRVDIHRRLGIAGFLLAVLMVVLGVLAATDSLVREAGPPGSDPKYFYIIPLILLCHKRRVQQNGQQGSRLSRNLASLIRSVAIDVGLCRSARMRRAAGPEVGRNFLGA